MRNFDFRRALTFSLVLHVVLAMALVVVSFVPDKTFVPETVSIEFLPSPGPAPEAPPARVKKRPVPIAKQIVEQDEKSLNDEKPLDDAFLSARDQRVRKQTAAREHGAFRNARDEKTVESKTQGARKKEIAKRPRLDDLLGTSPEAMLEHKEETDRAADEGQGPSGAKSAEASRTDDYLRDLERGAETMLNTREFKYFTYYQRIRRQLSMYWEPKVRDKLTKMFRRGRTIASDQDHVTKLLIVLNEKGTLVRVQVLSASGVADLDDAATEAFRSAAPFPNPPAGIVESDGTVKIRWDFVLES